MDRRIDLIQKLVLAVIAIAVTAVQLPQLWMGDGFLEGSDLSRADAEPELRPYRFEAPVNDERSPDYAQVRVKIEADSEGAVLGLVLVEATQNTRVFLNNIRVRGPNEASDYRGGAVFLSLPHAFWHEGENTLDVITPNTGLRAGPSLMGLIRSEADRANIRTYIRVNSNLRLATVVAGLCVAILLFVSLVFSPTGEPGRWWHAAFVLSLAGAVGAQTPAAGSLLPVDWPSFFGMACALVAMAIALGSARVLRPSDRSRLSSDVLFVMALVAPICFLAGLAGSRWGPPFEPWPALVLAVGVGMALTHLGMHMLTQLVAAGGVLFAAIQRSIGQEALIREQERMISQQSADLEAQIHRRAVLEERERFSRDIHDGLGGSLLSLLVEVRSGNVESDNLEAALESNLDELRMMIDSLDHAERSLNAALSTYRTRVQHLFDSAQIELAWLQPDTALPERATPDFILHLYRILQEAGSNIVRHSQATQAEYRFDWDDAKQQLLVVISDNGLGSPAQSAPTGNGLKNMARRVEEMQGKFAAGPAPDGGWAIRFSVPV